MTCLSIMIGVGDVVLRQPLLVMSVNGFGYAATDPTRRGPCIWLREPNISFANAGAAHPCNTPRRANTRPALAKAATRRMATASKRRNYVAGDGSTGQLGRSKIALFARGDALRCSTCTFKARSAHRYGTMLRSSLCKRAICIGIVSTMDQCRPTQQFGRVCLRSPHD